MVGSKKSRKQQDKEILAKLARIHTRINKKYGTPHCKKGEIARTGFVKTSKGKKIEVASTCIKDRGSSGKGIARFHLRKGTLSRFGYHNVLNLTKEERRKALRKAISRLKPLSVFRKLIAVRTLNKKVNPKLARLLSDDAKWIQQTKQYLNRNV
jgi:hypothetical protein